MPVTPDEARSRIIVALDCDRDQALEIAEALKGRVGWLKVGMTLFYEAGPTIVSQLRDLGFDVFLDLKLHDIPHQVSGAAERIGRLGARMLTVHASGGSKMIAAAVEGARRGARAAGVEAPSVIAVTVLTSTDDAGLREIGISRTSAEQVALLGAVTRDAGAAGVVCSPKEAAAMREVLGPDALVVTPGVRPVWAATGDQSRIATPADALASGASHLVIGRPITDADDRAEAVERIVAEFADE